mgnify:CR=1 FL=1
MRMRVLWMSCEKKRYRKTDGAVSKHNYFDRRKPRESSRSIYLSIHFQNMASFSATALFVATLFAIFIHLDCPCRPCESCEDYKLEIYEGKFKLNDNILTDINQIFFISAIPYSFGIKKYRENNLSALAAQIYSLWNKENWSKNQTRSLLILP